MLYFYLIIAALGLASSYTDIKFKKIKNIHLLIAIAMGLAAYVYLIVTHQMTVNMNLAWNILIGIGIGLILYLTDTWSAGDAKLFMVFCLLMPAAKGPSLFFFPSIAIFMNIFLASMLAILILSTSQIIKDRKIILKKIFSVSTLSLLGISFLTIFCFKWIIENLISFLIPQGTPLISLVVLFFMYQFIQKKTGKRQDAIIVFLIFGLTLVLRFLIYPLDSNIENFLSYLKLTLFYTLLLHILFIIFNLKKSDNETKKTIPFALLMFLGVMLTNTNFTNWIIQILDALKK